MKENESVSWHPSFAAALQLELQAYRDILDYVLEFPLTSEPLKVDVIVLKETKKPINKNIAQLFRTYNIVEYKSPKDYIAVRDLYKSIAYVYLYKYVIEQQEASKDIDIRHMTLTLVCMNQPKKLFKHLQEREKDVYTHQQGIYYVQGMDIPIQIIIQSKLSSKDNEYLTLLTDQLQDKEPLQRALKSYFHDNQNELYRLIFPD
jgi:hypothetical protein